MTESAGSALLEAIERPLEAGRLWLAEAMARWLGRREHPWLERLEGAVPDVFLHPALFGVARGDIPDLPLEQVLLAALDHAPPEIDVVADADGVVHFPGLGRIRGARPGAGRLTIASDRGGPTLALEATLRPSEPCGQVRERGDRTPVTLEPIARLGPAGPELDDELDPCEQRLVQEALGGASPRVLAFDPGPPLEAALASLERSTPPLARALAQVVRRIVVLSHPDGRSFASYSTHGAIYLFPRGGDAEPFFLEDLVHQGGHVLLNTICPDRRRLFQLPPTQPLASLALDSDDPRSLDVAFHGVFTECLMALALHRDLAAGRRRGEARLELRGRLGFVLRRLELDLRGLGRPGVFTEVGAAWLERFGAVFDEVVAAARDQILGLDLRDQPYVFCRERFARANPRDPHES